MVETSRNTIEAALLALAARDTDMARVQNGEGFNGRDTVFGNSLAEQIRAGRTLSDKQKAAAYKMLRTYKKQLASYGIDYDAIAENTQSEQKPKASALRLVHFRNGKFIVAIPFADSAARESFKTVVPQRFWDGDNKFWTAPESSSAQVITFAKTYGYELSEDARRFASPDDIAAIASASTPTSQGKLEVAPDGKAARVLFPSYPGASIVEAIKRLPGRTYDSATKVWSVPISPASVPEVKKFVDEYGLAVDGMERIAEAERKFLETLVESTALDADIEVKGLALDLMPFQKAGVFYTLKNLEKGKGVYICDEMGLGKTPQSLAVIQAENLYPALAVVPKVVWLNWAREVNKWLPGKKVALLAGKNVTNATHEAAASVGATVVALGETIPADADVVVVNYDILTKWAVPMTRANKSIIATGVLADYPFKGLIFDEAHLMKERKAMRTKAAIGLVKKHADARVIALSGTPVPNRPSELITLIKDILNRLDEVGGWNTLWQHHCQGWAGGAMDLASLNEKMRSAFYVRRVKKDVLPELPPVRWVPVSVEMTNPTRYRDVERDLAAWMKERLGKDESWQQQIEHLDDSQQDVATQNEAARRADRISSSTHEVLVKLGALRQVAADEKMDATIEWLEAFLDDSTEKIIVFGIHRAINERLAQHFDAPLIYGGMDAATRFDAEQRFQTDPKTRVLVCSIDAAGVGLTLTAASHVAFVEVPWRPMDIDQAVARAYGRLSDLHGVTAYLVSAPNTIEDRIIRMVEEKRNLTGITSDGISIAADLVRDLMKRGAA